MPDYFCTVGFGLDSFAIQELQTLPGVSLQETLVGKVFFKKEDNPSPLLTLKTVERLFIKILHEKSDTNATESFNDWLSLRFQEHFSLVDQCLLLWSNITNRPATEPLSVKFRVNTRLSGKFRKASNYQQVSRLASKIFVQISSHMVVELCDPDLEVFVHLNDNFLTVGLQVTQKPLSDRSYLKHITVRSTVCCAMCMAVQLTAEDVLLDPMCGAATILIEACKQFNCKAATGVDCDLSQLNLARANLSTSHGQSRVELICADSCTSFVRQNLFDVVLCDVPFGRKFGNPKQIQTLLTSVIKAIDVLLKPKGRVGILISDQLRQTLIELCSNWTLLNQHPLRLGTLPAAIVTWTK